MNLKGQHVLITGASGGVGQALARKLHEAGASLTLTDLDDARGQELVASLGSRANFLIHDVSSPTDWTRVVSEAVKQQGPLTALVNNAGILIRGDIESQNIEQWRQLMQVNADSVFLGTQAGVQALKDSGGSIVNVASLASWMPMDAFIGYSASKAAVAAVTRSAALHCRKSGYRIRVNSVHPDGIWTPMMEASLRETAPHVKPEYLLFDAQRNPKGRACRPEQVADVIAFLISDESCAISGAELRVDNSVLGMGL